MPVEPVSPILSAGTLEGASGSRIMDRDGSVRRHLPFAFWARAALSLRRLSRAISILGRHVGFFALSRIAARERQRILRIRRPLDARLHAILIGCVDVDSRLRLRDIDARLHEDEPRRLLEASEWAGRLP